MGGPWLIHKQTNKQNGMLSSGVYPVTIIYTIYYY